MKTCVVRRRFYATEADNATVDVDLEPNFGIPKAAVVYYIENSANTDAFDTTLAFRNCGVGICGAGSTVCMDFTLRDNVSPTDTQKSHFVSRFINATSSDRATTYYRVDTVTFVNDKIRLAFTNATPQTNGHLDALIWAITGDDVTVGVGISSFSPTNGGTRVYSGLSFQPDFVLVTSNNLTSGQTLSDSATFSIGMATRSPLRQASIGWSTADAAATVVSGCRVSDADIMQLIREAAGARATIGSFTSSGWTMTTSSTLTGNIVYNFLAVKSQSPSDFALLNISTPISTGNNFIGTGSTGFVPETLLGAITYVSTINALQTASNTGADGFGLFAGTATSFSKLYNGNGTITYSTGSSTVSGSGTTFWKFIPGDILYTPDGSTIGTISSVGGTTTLTLTASAALNGTNQSYTYSTYRQGTLSIGDNDANATTTVYSHASSRLLNICEATPSNLVQGYLQNFDTRPGFQIGYSTVDASARLGFAVAFKSQNANRRRGSMT